MLSSSTTYKQAIHGPFNLAAEVDVLDASGAVLLRDLPIVSGNVSAALQERVTRRAALTVAHAGDRTFDLPGGLFPDGPTDPTSPAVGILRVRAGIQYADQSRELFPLIVGRIQEASLNADGSVTLSADDRAADVVEFRFEQPRAADRPTILGQIQRLILEAVPGAMFGPHDVADAPTPPSLVWDEDRGQAVDDLAEALGGRWYSLGDGTFVVRSFPYDNGTVVQEIRDGEAGLLTEATITRSRAGTANSVTVVSERLDGTDPVRVTARNTVPGSPTAYGDAFGRVTQPIKLQTPLTNSEAQRLARNQLNASTALLEQWSVSCVPDHTLEPGDPVRFSSRGRTTVQVIDQITYPLIPGDPMTISTRAFSVPPALLGA